MSDRIMHMIEEIVRLAEEYGAVMATHGDKYVKAQLEDRFSFVMRDIKRELSTAHIQYQQQHQQAQAQYQLHALQQLYQQILTPHPIDPLAPPAESSKDPIKVEFSLTSIPNEAQANQYREDSNDRGKNKRTSP